MGEIDYEKELGGPTQLGYGMIWYTVFILIAAMIYFSFSPIVKIFIAMI